MCNCLTELSNLYVNLKGLPLALLSQLIPPLPPIPPLAMAAAGTGVANAFASMSARVNAAIALGLPPFPIPGLLARIEMIAALRAMLGARASANLSAALSASIGMWNSQLPLVLPNLLGLLAPLLDLLQDLLDLLNVADLFRMNLNLILAVPGAAVGLGFGASLSASVMANLSVLHNFALWGRLFNATAALGINLALPGAMASLSATLSAFASLKLPGLAIPLPQLGMLASLIAPLARLPSFGMNITMPNLMNLLKALLAALLPNLRMNVALSESLSAAATLGAVVPALGLNFSAMASLAASFNLSASLAASLNANANLNALAMLPNICNMVCGLMSPGSGAQL